jgi:hypothetical protein
MKSYLLNLLTTLIVVAIGGAILYGVLKPNITPKLGKNLTTEDLVDFWSLNCWELKIPQKYQKGFNISFYVQKGKEKPIRIGGHGESRVPDSNYLNRKLIGQNIGNNKYKIRVTRGGQTIFSPDKYFKNMNFHILMNFQRPLEPNKIFVKYTSKNTISNSPKLEDWECGLFYEITSYNKKIK